KTCASCGQIGEGKYCASCGAPLDGPLGCRSCGNELPAGARFCNMCGTPAASTTMPAAPAPSLGPGGGSSSAGPPLPWIVAGIALALLAAVLIVTRLGQEPTPSSVAPPIASAPVGDPSAIDLDSMTPREAADRLFERVMTSLSAGDSAAARSFAPMAVAAYQLAEPLDVDGRYHLASLQLVAGDAAAAADEAAAILREVPTHLFGFYTSAQAAAALGDPEAAREHFRGLLQNYDAEVAMQREEYVAHVSILPEMRRDAVAATE
ncbi:MAG TPA: zinc ribbon domain-containing protein, partial [Longimicrobiaceae bacterium]|nr:zinc ribbon domain-containing protein [Longimicrobiaceae bacterium]